MDRDFYILDCTLRDGGLRWKDLGKEGFSKADKEKILSHLLSSEIEIIELGEVDNLSCDLVGASNYKSLENLCDDIPVIDDRKAMFVAMYADPSISTEDIPEFRPGLCDGIRVVLRYSELDKSLQFCREISKKGYKLFIQPALTLRYTDDELLKIINVANELNAYALYIVDSFGYMTARDLKRLFEFYDKNANSLIKIGLHAHNNINLGFSNALEFLSIKSKRQVIVDSCLMGIGRGGGNVQTELLIGYINRYFNCSYNFSSVLSASEIVNEYFGNPPWGYSLIDVLSALNKTAYKYASVLRNDLNMSFSDIDKVLISIPNNLKNHFTEDNLSKILNLNNFKG